MACDATDAPTPIVTAARARFVSAFAAALDIARRRVRGGADGETESRKRGFVTQ